METETLATSPHPTAPAKLIQADAKRERPSVVGPDSGPHPPYPIYLRGAVASGFGRGSKELGCPTANLPEDTVIPHSAALDNGVLYGFARVSIPSSPDDNKVFPMVMSVGWNPYYKNEKKTAEVHIMHEYHDDFYGKDMRVVILGYIRPQFDYTTLDALIEDIETDKRVTLNSLDRPPYEVFQNDAFFSTP